MKNLSIFSIILLSVSLAEKIRYLSLEHATILLANSDYLANLSLLSTRFNRNNPKYYLNGNGYTLHETNNSYLLCFYILELRSNRYHRSFVEVQFKACEAENEPIFGKLLLKYLNNQRCPYPSGYYHFDNVTMSPALIPKSFPFNKGRIVLNVTDIPKRLVVLSAYVDIEIKEIKVSKAMSVKI